jgi:muramoyltetrapeptide carboxypeptidase
MLHPGDRVRIVSPASTPEKDGVYRCARANPKFVVGFSDITNLHLILWQECRLVGIHGPMPAGMPPASVEALRRSVMTPDPVALRSDALEATSVLTTTGRTSGRLLGGNLDAITTAAGWSLPSFDGTILLVEGVGVGLGHIDRQLTMLTNAGHLDGLRGVAVGQFTKCGTHGDWTAVDVLRDRLNRLGVPILGGLPIGHGMHPRTVPLGTVATLDADAGTLVVDSGTWHNHD